MISLQNSVNKLQAELLTYKDDEVKELKSVVKSTVESSVKSEFLSYSSVLKKRSLRILCKTLFNKRTGAEIWWYLVYQNKTVKISTQQQQRSQQQAQRLSLRFCLKQNSWKIWSLQKRLFKSRSVFRTETQTKTACNRTKTIISRKARTETLY